MKLRDVRILIRAKVALHGCRGYAHLVGCSPAYVSHVCSGRTVPGPKFLENLGLKKVTRYVRVKEKPMTLSELAEGATILVKYAKKSHSVAAEHDIIYLGDTPPGAMKPEDVKRLEQLRYSWDTEYDCWAHFT